MQHYLANEQCQVLSKGSPALDTASMEQLLNCVSSWETDSNRKSIHKAFRFENYYQTIAFVNMVAWIAHQQDHHPDLQVSYRQCTVTYSTHSVNGLSRNDFICAAKLDMLSATP